MVLTALPSYWQHYRQGTGRAPANCPLLSIPDTSETDRIAHEV